MDEAPTPEEIYSAIKYLKVEKSTGLDGLAAEFYQRGGDTITEEIVKVILHIWNTEIVPKDLKDAQIITIYKRKGDKSDCGNWREISLLSTAGKVLSKILLNKLVESIAEETFLSPTVASTKEEAPQTWYLP